MAEPARGIGKGLASILGGSGSTLHVVPQTGGDEEAGAELREIGVDLIDPNPNQPRHDFDDEAMQALTDSLRVRGVLQPVLVRPERDGRFELIAGERRWRAARLAGLATIPALVRPDLDAESLELALIENMARQDLNPVEEARACQALIDEMGWGKEELGRRVGRSRAAIANLLRLLDLPDDVLDLVGEGKLSSSHGRALLMADDHADRKRLAFDAVHEGWSVRRLEDAARVAGDEAVSAPAATTEGVAGTGATAWEADHKAAARRLADSLGEALGMDVKVKAKGLGFTVGLTLADWDEAVELAERLGAAGLVEA